MYKLPHFTEEDKGKMIAFIKEHSFAMVTGMGDLYPEATHLPLEIVEEADKVFFTGHLMKKTSHHLAFEKNKRVLVLFRSPYAYVNAGWYEDPKQGSTVNYMAVHAKGIFTFLNEEGTYEIIRQITNKHIGHDSPASFTNLPEAYISNMIKAIVGFRIEVESMEAVFKLSQNKHTEDQKTIIHKLEERNEPGSSFIASEMKKRLP
jgi:transcriptional regulator